jgi:hypothetical protein
VRSRTFVGMARRALPALLVAAAALADASGEFGLALYALLAAVPVLAFAGLDALGELLEGESEPGRQLQALLCALALALVLAGAAVRAPAVRDGELPALAGSALFACLVALALEALVAAGRVAVERPPRRHRSAASAEELREAA